MTAWQWVNEVTGTLKSTSRMIPSRAIAAAIGAVLFFGTLLIPSTLTAQDAANATPIASSTSLGELFGEEAAAPSATPPAAAASLTDMFAHDDAPSTPAQIADAMPSNAIPTPSVTIESEPVIKIVFLDDAGNEEIITGEPSEAVPAESKTADTVLIDITSEDSERITVNHDDASERESLLYADAIQHVAAGRLREAELTLRALVDQHPLSPLTPPALFELIRIMESPHDKITWCNYFITNYPDSEWSPRVYLVKGDVLAKAGDNRDAMTAYELAASTLTDPALRMEAVRKQLQMLALVRDYDGVLKTYDHSPIPSLSAKDSQTQFWVLKALLGLQRWKEAMDLANRLSAVDSDFPNQAEVLLIRATLLEHSHQTSEAKTAYEALVASHPQHPAIPLVKARLASMSQSVWPPSAARSASGGIR